MELDRELYRIRRIEERLALEYPKGEMRCPVHLSIGQEAPAVGVCAALTNKDLMVSTHRSHAHYLAKGGDLKRMLCELYGKKNGCSRGQGGSMHLVDWSVGFAGSTSIVGGTIPVGVGMAWAMKLKGERNLTAVMIGDAAIEEGVFHEAANFASLHHLPVLFVCENNQYSCFTKLTDRRINKNFRKIAEAHELEYVKVQGSAHTIKVVTGQYADRIRHGYGPVLLEIDTWRYVEHCGPNNDDNLGYRPAKEVAEWAEKDPMLHVELPPTTILMIQEEIDEAFAYTKAAKFPDISELGKYTYA